jgi:hypothetical protein
MPLDLLAALKSSRSDHKLWRHVSAKSATNVAIVAVATLFCILHVIGGTLLNQARDQQLSEKTLVDSGD